MATKPTTSDWQVVQRRRARPSSPPRASAQHASHMAVYSSRPSYAQVVQRGGQDLQQRTTRPQQTQHSGDAVPPSDASPASVPRRQSHPQRSQSTRSRARRRSPPQSILSPEHTSNLHYPPSPSFPEWKLRCFRCFRKGHLSATCYNPMRCASCWGQGHDYVVCPKDGGKAPDTKKHRPLQPRRLPLKEPSFDDVLDGSDPSVQTLMPPDSERPPLAMCYISRDMMHFSEVDRLSKGLVITQPSDYEVNLSLDTIANHVASTGLVTPNQLSIGVLAKGRYLVLPPSNNSALDLALALPENWWNIGFTAGLWSLLIDAEVSIPRYKAWVQLVGPPAHVWREEYIIQLVSQFGVYLGSIQSDEPGNMSYWDMVVATPDLAKIPLKASFEAGGLSFQVAIQVRQWRCVPVYSSTDLPTSPPHISPPSMRISHTPPKENDCRVDGDTIVLNLSSMRDIFRNVNYADLPADIAKVLRQNPDEEGSGVSLSRNNLSVVAQTSGDSRARQQINNTGSLPQ